MDPKSVMYALVCKINHKCYNACACNSLFLNLPVFGWLQDSFMGVEQEEPHILMAGYQKGAQRVGLNFTFTINERDGGYLLFGEHC